MKKLFLGMAALVAMVATSCVQTEELAVANNKEAIGFDTFVENVTKTIYDNNNPLDHFDVYGTISKKNADDTKTYVTTIFDKVEVLKSGDTWSYDPNCTQYWIPGFIYDFAAVVDATNVVCENGLPATISTNMIAQNDVLYATKNCDFVNGGQTDKVSFQLAHLLSKAKFTVKNGIVNGQNFVYNVESIKIKNADKDAKYDVATGKWTATNTYEASFGAISEIGQQAQKGNDTEVLLVPGTKELAIAIKYNLTYNDAELVNTTKNLTAVLTLEQGKAYNFVVEFGNPGEDIKFDAVVDTWVEGNYDVNGTSVVATAEEFTTAFASEGIDNIVLASDIDLDGTTRSTVYSLIVASGRTLTLDLNGHTLSGNWHKDNGAIIKNEGTLTVVGGTISSLANNGGSAILNYGTLTVEDATLNGAPIVDGGWPSYAINNYGNLTVNRADIKTYHGAIATGDKGVTVINYASVDVGQSTQTKQTSWALYVFEDGQLTVNGGIFKNTKDEKNKVYGGGYICAISTKETIINGGTFEKTEADNNGTGIYYNCTNLVINGGVFDTNPTKYVAEGCAVVENNGAYTVIPTTLKDGGVLDLGGAEYNGTIIVEGNVTIKGDTNVKTIKSTTGCTITIEDGKTLTLNNFSFGAKENAEAVYEIKGGTVTANYGFFQHGKYELYSDFETGYMYYSYGSDITVYGTFHSQGKGDGLDYVRGKLTIANGGKSIHDKSLWVGQPASWGAMNASLVIEEGGYVQANSLSVYEGSSLTYSNDADLKYNSVTGTEYIIKK